MTMEMFLALLKPWMQLEISYYLAFKLLLVCCEWNHLITARKTTKMDPEVKRMCSHPDGVRGFLANVAEWLRGPERFAVI